MIGILSSLLPVASTILDRVVPDKNAAQKAKLEMEKELTSARRPKMEAGVGFEIFDCISLDQNAIRLQKNF